MNGWRYYNHAAVASCDPHETPDISVIEDGSLWKKLNGGKPLLARWTSDFDCNWETQWWYIIKDTPFDISSLKAKRRYEINKGNKFFDVRWIDPGQYKEALFHVQIAAFSAYPEKYRPVVRKDAFFKGIDGWKNRQVFGAFFRENGQLCGYALLNHSSEKCIHFSVLKTIPEYERHGLNAALVYKVLEENAAFLENGGYICDGERSINHETAFQDYLEKYFGFRKAYCRIHVAYPPMIKVVVKLLYPFRNMLLRFDHVGLVHSINGVIRMEGISRDSANNNGILVSCRNLPEV